MFNKIYFIIGHIKLKTFGWHTNRKIVVLESDDWGSIRMPSKEVYNYLLNKGIRVDKCHFCKYDSLASEKDLSELFEVLISFKDHCGNHPVITANTVVVNPDFEKIKNANYSDYHYQLFTNTLKEYPQHEKSFQLWKEGISLNIFCPQFHGREHLNITRWLKYLRNQSVETQTAFDHKLFGLSTTVTKEKRKSFLAAFEFETEEEMKNHAMIISDGIRLFQQIFGKNAISFVAPNYKWHSLVEETLYNCGVRSIQGLFLHQDVSIDGYSCNQKFRFIGQKNVSNLYSLVRNTFFEPSELIEKDWVNSCIKDISTAFYWKKPAIICSHRVNYIGYIDSNNRDKNLKLLKTLLSEIMKRWPDVEFISSEELTKLIMNGKR